MSNNVEEYKKVTDEFYSFYTAFRASGFTDEQAFELVKAYCTSHAVQNILENERRKEERVNYREILNRRQQEKTFANAMKESKT